MKTKKVLFIANFSGLDEEDWFIFVAPENCDKRKEFIFAYNCENGKDAHKQITIGGIYNINMAFDYRASDNPLMKNQGKYNIALTQ